MGAGATSWVRAAMLFGAATASGGADAGSGRGGEPVVATSIVQEDALRFAALMRSTNYRPTAAQLQQRYLDGSDTGVRIFTPGRIESADNLAKTIAAEPQRYRYAIETCLPLIDALNASLKKTYRAYSQLLPKRRLPAVHVVFGAANSGGTATADAQVLGLEVLCGPGTSAAQFATTAEGMFAHETVHSWQPPLAAGAQDRDLLLLLALREGVPDYLAFLATGQVPNAERNEWAKSREAQLWAEFEADRRRVAESRNGPFSAGNAGNAAIRRWFMNYGSAPAGWPSEAGYWVGMRIAEAFVARSGDRKAAIEILIAAQDPVEILRQSGYSPR